MGHDSAPTTAAQRVRPASRRSPAGITRHRDPARARSYAVGLEADGCHASFRSPNIRYLLRNKDDASPAASPFRRRTYAVRRGSSTPARQPGGSFAECGAAGTTLWPYHGPGWGGGATRRRSIASGVRRGGGGGTDRLWHGPSTNTIVRFVAQSDLPKVGGLLTGNGRAAATAAASGLDGALGRRRAPAAPLHRRSGPSRPETPERQGRLEALIGFTERPAAGAGALRPRSAKRWPLP